MPAAAPSSPPLDDVMIAMDVVDELRHDERVVERELDAEGRRQQLVERLREIYRGQGIEVTDRILEEGVKALEEERFVYKPPPDSLATRLARVYVARGVWGRWAVGIVGGIALLWALNHVVFERPRLAAIEAARIEAEDRLPAAFRKLSADIASEARDAEVKQRAEEMARSGLNAARSGDLETARAQEAELKGMLARLREEFTIRIVSRQGESTGLWRIPDQNPQAYNYYVVVEALDRSGRPVPQEILNEETGKRERVTTWAVRVDRSVLEAVKADKEDDGIVQRSEAGVKRRGDMEPRWTIPVAGGAITRW